MNNILLHYPAFSPRRVFLCPKFRKEHKCEQKKLYAIEEKTYEAHVDEEVHLYGLLHQLAVLVGKIKNRRDMENLFDTARRYGKIADRCLTVGASPADTGCSATRPTLPG